MSESPNTANRRQQQAQARRYKRKALNLHYMEEEALRALESGSLKPLAVELDDSSWDVVRMLSKWMGSDEDGILNVAICLASSSFINVDLADYRIRRMIPKFGEGSRLGSNLWSRVIQPTPETVRALVRVGGENAGSAYAMAGLRLLFEGLQYAHQNQKEIMAGKLITGPRE